MKDTFSTLVVFTILLSTNLAFGQLVLPYSGSTSSSSKAFSVTNTGGGSAVYGLTTDGGHGVHGRSNGNSGSAVFAESYGGGVGVNMIQRGTGHGAYFRVTNTTSYAYALISKNAGLGPSGYYEINNPSNSSPVLWAWTNGSGWTGRFETNSGKGVYINTDSLSQGLHVENGTVQIGDTAVPSGYKMAIDGNLIVEELKVQLAGQWPDYVFEDDYALTPLAEVESYIKANRHLPGLPSAEAVAEAGGVEVGDMQAKLLMKIEELTLHLIAQQKINAQLQERLANLEARTQNP